MLVAETREKVPQFDPEHEADLNHVLKSGGGTPDTGTAPRTDLPPIVMTIPSKPPSDFPEFDPAKSEIQTSSFSRRSWSLRRWPQRRKAPLPTEAGERDRLTPKSPVCDSLLLRKERACYAALVGRSGSGSGSLRG